MCSLTVESNNAQTKSICIFFSGRNLHILLWSTLLYILNQKVIKDTVEGGVKGIGKRLNIADRRTDR